MATTHKLGFTTGTITDHGDGTASYRKPVGFLPSFRVTIADVTGFTETKGGTKNLQNTLHVLGAGGEIATCDVDVGVTPKIEAWFRAHPDFGRNAPGAATASTSGSLADELTKLAALRDAGVLTPAEFEQQKARLLG